MLLITWPINLVNSGNLPFEVCIPPGYGFVLAPMFMPGPTSGGGGVIALLLRFPMGRDKWT
jgi:hypothetical protein